MFDTHLGIPMISHIGKGSKLMHKTRVSSCLFGMFGDPCMRTEVRVTTGLFYLPESDLNKL